MPTVKDDQNSRPVWFLPNVADLIFLVLVLFALRLGASALLNDPGTPWHVRVGMEVWQSGPPQVDSFSFSRAGQPWISQYWLFDAVLAKLYGTLGWNGVVVGAALLLGWTYRSLFLSILETEANVAWSAALTMLAAGCGASHWLARPHLVSLLFFVFTVRWCLDFHRHGVRSVWWLPPLMALWCNIHGGFLAGLIVIACSLFGQALSVPRDSAWRGRMVGFGLVLTTSIFATLVNPYGWRLHAHLGDLLFSSQVRELIDEWRAPDFQAAESQPLEAIFLLCIVLVALGRRRISVFSLVHLVVWIHLGLLAVRQVAFTALIAVPLLGELTPGMGLVIREQLGLGGRLSWIEELGRRATVWAIAERAARWPIGSLLISALLVLGTAGGITVPALGIGTARFSNTRWPIEAVNRLNQEPPGGALFNDLNWGGYLILVAEPRRPVFVDDRFELYGRKFILEYLDALRNGPSWTTLLDRYHFELILIRSDVPLARALRDSPDWELLHANETATLLRRQHGPRLASANSD